MQPRRARSPAPPANPHRLPCPAGHPPTLHHTRTQGTFVALNGRAHPLVVAGGGGGASYNVEGDGGDASLDESGAGVKGAFTGQGGAGGHGGHAAVGGTCGFGGGGLGIPGQGSTSAAGGSGEAFVDGGKGGAQLGGGFGGGGGHSNNNGCGGGGGGGYGGGGAGNNGGGGGGSFIRPHGATDVAKRVSDHAHGNDGLLTITLVTPPGPTVTGYIGYTMPLELFMGVTMHPLRPTVDLGASIAVARFVASGTERLPDGLSMVRTWCRGAACVDV